MNDQQIHIAIQSKNIPAMEFHAGDTLQIEGEFSFGQDHSFWRGEIPDTTFTVRDNKEETKED